MPTLGAKRPLSIIVCVILVITLGVISFTKMPSTLLPEFELPYVVAYTAYPGAAPEKVEQTVTRPLESALGTTGGLESISSVSSENLSLIIMQFAYSTNMDSALIEMNGSIDLVKGYFDEAVSAPTLMRIDPDMLPVIVAAVSVDGMDAAAASAYAKSTVIPALERVEGVAQVSAMGLVESALRVTLDDAKLNALQEKLNRSVENGFAEGYSELDDAQAELDEGREQLEDGYKKLEDGQKKLNAELRAKEKELNAGRQQLKAARGQIEQGLAAINAGYAPESGRAELEASLAALVAQETQLNEGEAALKTARRQAEAKLEQGRAELNDAKAQLEDAQAQLDDGREQLNDAKADALAGANARELFSSAMLSGVIAAGNLSMPAGYVEGNGQSYTVKVGVPFASAEEIENLLLLESEEESIGTVRVKDIATVEQTDNSAARYARINGQDGILLTANKQSSASTTEVSRRIRAALGELGQKDGLHSTILSDQGVYIDIVVQSVIENLLMGAVLAILVLMLFLRSFRPTLVVALSIPVSLLLAVTLMYFFEISLNLVSLCGLAMGVGMLVDNSIVVIENIYRLRAEGVGPVKAAIMGAKEVAGAITASTLTTVCVFVPIVFTEGLSKELFMDMGLTIAFSLIASLLVAMSVVPALGTLMLQKEAKRETAFYQKFMALYERSLRFVLNKKGLVLALCVILLCVSVYGAITSGTAFLPESDSLQLIVSATAEKGLSAMEARSAMDGLASRFLAVEGVSDVGVMSGGATDFAMGGNATSGGARGGESQSFTLYAVLDENRAQKSAGIADELIAAGEGLPVTLSVMSGSMDITSLMGSGISVDLYGNDLDVLREEARRMAAALAAVEGVAAVNDGVGETDASFTVELDRDKAMAYGLTAAQVYSAVSAALTTESTAATLSVGSIERDVVVVKGEESRYSTETLKTLPISGTKDGKTVKVPLGDIAAITQSETQRSIRRGGGARTLSVTAEIAPGYNIGLVSEEIEAVLADYELPDGLRYELTGENKTISDTLSDIILMGLLGLLLIYLIMVAQFQSLLSPFIVMFTIPLAFTGGFLLQWACGFEVSVISMLGLLVLFGVVVNNGIVFVDCANGLYAELGDKREALVQAGRRRMRPILMTALTTILALITMCFGLGQGADMIQPMAVVLAGGLTYGTALTLFVVPALYELFRRKPPRLVDTEH